MAFKAKAKRDRGGSRLRSRPNKAVSAQKARLNRPFAPNRATPASIREAAESDDPQPNLMDLLCLHFKDKGFKTKIATTNHGSSACLQLQINLSEKPPFGSLSGEVILGFHFYNNMIWHTAPGGPGLPLYRPYPMGTPEDPELITRMEGTIDVFICGANSLSKLVRAALS